MHSLKPFAIALKGKGPATLFKRAWTISRRYGLTAARMDNALARLSRLLQQFQCRATLPVTTVTLLRNSAVIQKYQAQGVEFAVHGYRHVDHSRLSLAEQVAQFRKAGQVFREHGIRATGFRSPYLRWNEHTLTALTRAEFGYDSSPSLAWDVDPIHVTDSYRRALSFYGAEPATACPALPYLDTASNLVRIPYCLPDDEALVERLKWNSPAEMDRVWPDMFHQMHQQGVLFTLGLHPERVKECTRALTATLQEVSAAGSAVWRAGLGEIAAWWKARYATVVKREQLDTDLLQLKVEGPPGVTLLLRSVEAKTATQHAFDGYQRAGQGPCVIRTPRRPFIGVSPAVPAALTVFLTQQGYIVETSARPELYSFYLDHNSFARHEEQRLLAQIETANFPLVRLGRWPHGCQSAFNVTGDIDALTFWDYSQRLWEK